MYVISNAAANNKSSLIMKIMSYISYINYKSYTLLFLILIFHMSENKTFDKFRSEVCAYVEIFVSLALIFQR